MINLTLASHQHYMLQQLLSLDVVRVQWHSLMKIRNVKVLGSELDSTTVKLLVLLVAI